MQRLRLEGRKWPYVSLGSHDSSIKRCDRETPSRPILEESNVNYQA